MSAVIALDTLRVPVDVGGAARKARLTIERDGSLRLRAGADVSTDELRAFLASKLTWIYRKLAEKEALRYEPITKELVDGEGFLYLGRSHRLRIADLDATTVKLERGRLVIPRRAIGRGNQALIDWYARRGLDWLPPRINNWAARLRVGAAGLDVRDLGYRWGAADAHGRISIHWATMQLSPPLIDYIIAHELAHLREPHHGPAFWQLLTRVQPDCDERKQELARAGASLWLGAAPDAYGKAGRGKSGWPTSTN